jgi:PadR family transcriptional regulator, regulatory protein AphA
MSLSHALLGLINYQPETGYELKARFESSIHFFWNATLPQIYRTLNQMKADGWLDCSVEHQEGKPSRKVYSLTAQGRREFVRWLEEPPEFGQQRDTILIKVFFGRLLGPAKLAAHLRVWRDYQSRKLLRLEHEAVAAIDRYRRHSTVGGDVPYWKFTLDCGANNLKARIDWCDRTLAALEAMAPPERE